MSAITLNCGNCAAYVPDEKNEFRKVRGRCHRYPPEYWIEIIDGSPCMKHDWPVVLNKDWCMQWSAIGHKPLGLGDD